MSGNLTDRPFLLLIMRVLRVMLWFCIASLVLVSGAIWYSVSQGFSEMENQPLPFIALLIVVAAIILFGVSRMLKQAKLAEHP